jgi:DNA polymerase III subunit delta'
MIVRRKPDADEPDRVAGQPHPRETYDLAGQDEALARAARAIRAARTPQAWLIAGPPGIGKATLAYRIARYLLRYGACAGGPADLAVPPGDIVSRQIEAGAHHGLLALKRPINEKSGKLMTVIPVSEIRRLTGFFGLTAGAGGWRVAIVDAADEMNDSAANALLKILEEPPPHSVLLLISHAPGRLLPTIRSRCQRLALKPLADPVMAAALAERLPETSDDDRMALVRIAEGSLGLALRLSGDEGLTLARDAETLIGARGGPDIPALLALGDRVARTTDGLIHFGAFLAAALSRRIRARAERGEGDKGGVALWAEVRALFQRAEGLHLEPRQSVLSSAVAIAEAHTRGAL